MDNTGTQKQITKNCHFVSRFLTKPWELRDRRLHYYDFDRNVFDESPSKTLFAEEEINTQPVEDWLCDTIERPLGSVRDRLAQGDRGILERDWRFFRAAVLMLWLQGLRSASVVAGEERRTLSGLASLPEAQLDALVNTIRQDHDLRLLFTVIREDVMAPLFFPSTGLFSITYRDPGCLSQFSIGVGLPIHPNCALVATGTETRGKADDSLFTGSLANCTVGTSESRLVVVHPDVLPLADKGELRASLLELRQANDNLRKQIHEVRHLIKAMYGEFGIAIKEDRSGRLLPPE